jgi:uncharacterized protein YjbJ (UPF0337 family)
MNIPNFEGDLKRIRIELKKKWAQLTDDDLAYTEGTLEEYILRIQLRTAATREAVEGFFRAPGPGED